ncbi:MAG: glycosyltransferase family 39 protein, partial [Bacteroidota bacterium]
MILILVTSIIRIVIASFTGLGPGEAYYFKGALLPNWSYFDQPPLFFWLSTVTVKLFGVSAIALRLPAILMFAGVIWLLYLITKHLFSAKAGWYAVILLNCSFVFTIPVAAWFQPDAPLMFFWLLTSFYLVKLFFRENIGSSQSASIPDQSNKKIYLYWILTGMALGLATLSKYHSALLLAGVLIFCVFHKEYRFWFRHPGPYLAVVICIIVSLPIFIWNAENNWVSFVFQGSRAGSDDGFTLYPQYFLRSIVGQALWLAPWIWIPLLIVFINSFKNISQQKKQFFIAATALLPIFIFTIVTLWRNTLFHFHWQAPGYLMLFILLGQRTADRLSGGEAVRLKTRRWIKFSAIAAVL